MTTPTCPYHIDGVNHAQFAAFGGWSGAINAATDEATAKAAFDYLSYVSQSAQSNVDVTIGATSFNPYRISQFEIWISGLKQAWTKLRSKSIWARSKTA